MPAATGSSPGHAGAEICRNPDVVASAGLEPAECTGGEACLPKKRSLPSIFRKVIFLATTSHFAIQNMRQVQHTDAAQKQLRKIPDAGRIRAKIQRFAEAGEGDVTALRGSPALRIRIGNYRALFTDNGSRILVHAIGHRREIYE